MRPLAGASRLSCCIAGSARGTTGCRPWSSWRAQVQTYALDFWGFGESAKQGAFSVDEYVEMVDQFMERMGLATAHVMGHSMGELCRYPWLSRILGAFRR